MDATTDLCGDDIIDSRDVIARIAYLEEDGARDETEQDELAALKAVAEQGEEWAKDWEYGAVLIRDSYFEDYARELADEIWAVANAFWPNSCIDWERAAAELKQDYTSITLAGVDYWVR
jgi:hypothetical protein